MKSLNYAITPDPYMMYNYYCIAEKTYASMRHFIWALLLWGAVYAIIFTLRLQSIEDGTIFYMPEMNKQILYYGTRALIILSLIEILWNLYRYEGAYHLRTMHFKGSKCTCSYQKLLLSKIVMTPLDIDRSEIEYTCPWCHKLVYHGYITIPHLNKKHF